MDQGQSTNSTEQRRKLLKGALGASTVLGMGYSSAALASFQCVTSTTPYVGDRFKKVLGASTNWAWLKLQVFGTNKSANNAQDTTDWKAVKIPTGNDPLAANGDIGTNIFYFDNKLASPVLYAVGAASVPNGINIQLPDTGSFVYVIVYFKTDGSITGFYPTHAQTSGFDYPAQGSCLTSLNPNMVQTNLFYGG